MTLFDKVVLGVAFSVALGWVAWRSLKRSHDDPGWLISKWILTAMLFPLAVGAVLVAGPLGMPILIVCSLIMGCLWAPNLGLMLARPLSSLYEGGHMDSEPEPMFSIAEARRKRGDYDGSVAELRAQLQKFPGHFRLQLTIAEVQAVELLDLAAAEQTIGELLAQPGHPPGEVAIALNWLSDWRLRLAQDREGAREALERVVNLFPETEQARMAEQRLAHLPPEEMLAARLDRRDVALPHGKERVGLRETPLDSGPVEEAPADLAARLVRQLELHPHDTEAREQLIHVYAGHYQRLDLATDQLEQMLQDPHQPQRQVVHWLNLVADLQVRHGNDPAAAGAALDRILERFPGTAAAETAMNRKARLALEFRGKQKSQVVKLGSYEQNIGLKSRPPRR